MTFNQWMLQEHGQNWQGVHMDLVDQGLSEEEINEQQNEFIEAFEEYMETHELEIIAE
ncbi:MULTISPECIES: hypothetical protein [unclassified Psychrobacillus]|uniref:hypothetical protein n=1 Tax=unclassified Psychrobacillus TaxID=2636677 RepID=UPI0030F80058